MAYSPLAYTIELTADEYRSAMMMSDRGYLGEITVHATFAEANDSDGFTLAFTEPDAWKVLETIEADPHAVWALTTPSTSLGQKFQAFINEIV